jgi:hypothetical protein
VSKQIPEKVMALAKEALVEIREGENGKFLIVLSFDNIRGPFSTVEELKKGLNTIINTKKIFYRRYDGSMLFPKNSSRRHHKNMGS